MRATRCRCPEAGEPRLAILDSYTKEHSAEYQAQAWIDLARRLGSEHPELRDPANVSRAVLHTSHHTHNVIGSGANDPQKYDPTASRETLDHSIPYIFTVALQDGKWDHNTSYSPERAARADTVALWHKVDDRGGHGVDAPLPLARPGREGLRRTRRDRPRRRNAHRRRDRGRGCAPAGRAPVQPRAVHRANSARWPTASCAPTEIERFLDVAQRLPELNAAELGGLTVDADLSDVHEPHRHLLSRDPLHGQENHHALFEDPRRREARQLPRRRSPAASCCGSPAPSTRCPRTSSRRRVSRASTSRAPSSRPTSDFPTSD